MAEMGFVAMLADANNEVLIEEHPLQQPQPRSKITQDKIDIATAMFNDGQKPAAVANALNCSLRKAQQMKKDTDPQMIGGQRQPYQPKKRGRTPQLHLIEARQQAVRNILTAEPDLHQTAVGERLLNPVKQCTISKDIKRLGWTRKSLQIVPFERNTPQNMQRRRQFAETINVINDHRLVYIDETGHNLHLSTTHGYAPAGQPAIRGIQANRGKNLTAIAAIHVGGLLYYKLVDGAANGHIFYDFLNELVHLLPQNAVLVMDNVRFHHGNLTQQWAAEHQHNVRIEYLPAYSPELNPIEEFFHMEKQAYRKLNHPVARTRQLMQNRVVLAMEEIRNRDLSGLFRHMREFLAVAYAGQPFV
jgi:transposase/arginine repressor